MKADNIQYTFMGSYVSMLSFFEKVDGALLYYQFNFDFTTLKLNLPVIKLFRSCPKIFDDNERSILSNKLLHFFNCRIVLNCET